MKPRTSLRAGRITAASLAAASALATALAVGAATATARAAASPPENAVPPAVSGTAREGETLAASTGSWSGTTPFTYAYRCNSAGAGCNGISGATGTTYTLASADAGSKIGAVVTAHNSYGSDSASSAATAVVGTGQPSGVVVVAGLKSVSASSLSLPDRLVIDKVAFSPSVLTSHNQAVTARFHVASTNGYVVRDALVYVLGLPYGWAMNAPETPTGVDGWATLTLHPTAQVPIRPGRAIVMFVRARKGGDNLLAGISTRRLVQLRMS